MSLQHRRFVRGGCDDGGEHGFAFNTGAAHRPNLRAAATVRAYCCGLSPVPSSAPK